MNIEIPVGTDAPRPCGIMDGMMRDYFQGDFYIVELYENGSWKQVLKTAKDNIRGDL